MNWFSSRESRVAFAALCGIAAGVLAVMAFHTSTVRGAERLAPRGPLELTAVPIPTATLSASTPSTAWITATSSSGPFCLTGFVVSPGLASTLTLPTGTATIQLQIIDNYGLSHPEITLFNGVTGGITPYDIVLSYGNQICAKQTIAFEAIEYEGPGPGTTIDLFGQAMVLAEHGNTVTITSSTAQPQ